MLKNKFFTRFVACSMVFLSCLTTTAKSITPEFTDEEIKYIEAHSKELEKSEPESKREDHKHDGKSLILVDPGHGGIDGGAVSKNGTSEKNINLDISLMLKEELEKMGFSVIMTRDKDDGLYGNNGSVREKKVKDLSERNKMIRSSNCDMFVSIHLNKFDDSRCKGAQVWYAKNKESEKFARILQTSLRDGLDKDNKRLEKAAMDHYKVLRGIGEVPGVIVECGFLSNLEEEKKLKDENYQKEIAKAIANGIKIYFDENIKNGNN